MSLSPPRRLSSYHSFPAPIIESERMLPDQLSSFWGSQKAPGSTSISSVLSNGTSTPKSSAELMKEITTLEVEIMHLECHLLSLYRTAFDKHLITFTEDAGNRIQHDTGLPLKVVANQSRNKLEPDMQNGSKAIHDWSSLAHGWASADNLSFAAAPKATSKRDQKNDIPVHRSLADHLGASYNDYTLTTPDRLSEDIIRCISSIYCKLAIPPLSNAGSSSSPTSSVTSTSTFSPQNPSDGWSPLFNDEVHSRSQGLKEESGPYATMIEVPKINFNESGFNYAASMLQKFRLMVQSLETVDPRKMKREGKLAFWINIHNALVMHAYLAYGTRSRFKSTSILKAAYNVGGHCINAYVIKSAILGIRPHHSEPWLQTLLSPGKKSKMGSVRHIYAIEYPEPLVHFALCSGTFSDPAVRVYTAKNIFQDLKLAKEEFIQASVHIHKASKIYLPKILYHFTKDTSLSMPGLMEIVNECISEDRRKAIIRCMKGRPEKYIYWLPQSSTFGYVIHMGLAKSR